ncbi:MAG: GNAT family N-acetyltransferase [Flavobacteriaceae bacterium]|nr:GNAT family N-acetyltransferase [Flavobacteriaceae bacterium]
MAISIEILKFDELDIYSLYALLQLRTAVFVVEQDCIYQDLDGKDHKAMHILGKKDGKIVAYTRLFAAGDYFKNPSIGRVVVAKDQRMYGYGQDIMRASIDYTKRLWPEKPIEISAQQYLLKFYNSLGFKEVGKAYLEDGIPHLRMLL